MRSMKLPGREELLSAAQIVSAALAPTPQIRWPLLQARTGAEAGSSMRITARSGTSGAARRNQSLYRQPRAPGISAGRRDCGNARRSQPEYRVCGGARARRDERGHRRAAHHNSREKNAAMRALGAELIEHGHNFQDALEFAPAHGDRTRPAYGAVVGSGAQMWGAGVASYAPRVFWRCRRPRHGLLPIGARNGSGICAMIAAREALGTVIGFTRIVSS